MTERALTKPEIIAALTRSPHGVLEEYTPVAAAAAVSDADFFARLIAWNHVKGEIRDSKIALPLIALGLSKLDHPQGRIFAEHALAHLADLSPRVLAKGLFPRTVYPKTAPPKGRGRAAKTVVQPTGRAVAVGPSKAEPKPVILPPFYQAVGAPKRVVRRFVTRYLRDLEASRQGFERAAVQHRHVLHEMYAKFHVSRPAWVGEILFHGEKGKDKTFPAPGTVFGLIRRLHEMGLEEAAGTIVKHHIPFIIARGALGKKAGETDTALALIKAMSPTELVTNTKWLEKLGLKTTPALRAAYEEALGKAITPKGKKPKATLKTTRAAEVLEASGETELSGKLRVMQEKQLDTITTVEGDWLVLGDKSGSMSSAIVMAMEIAALLARVVKGRVYLVFFDTSPRFAEVTGLSYEELKKMVRGITATGGTSIGCGLQAMLEKNLKVDGIAIVSDGGENTNPWFADVYPKYCGRVGAEPNVYLYQTVGDSDTEFRRKCQAAHLDVQTFDVSHGTVDNYSLPDLVQSMRVGRYQLLDEILGYEYRTLDDVLEHTKGMPVLPHIMPSLTVM